MAASATARARATACSSPISAGDRGTFERIFDFTRNQLLIRDDGLAAWKWDPKANPHIVDVNNASDGDILIAYALGLAGKAWGEPRYTEAATKIATAIGTNLLVEANGRVVLKPGVVGFTPPDRPDGTVVVNPSYWVFEAFPVLKELAPQFAWDELASSGAEIVAAARFGSAAASRRLGDDHRQGPRAGGGFPRGLRLQRHPHPALSDPRRARRRLPRSLRRPRSGSASRRWSS